MLYGNRYKGKRCSFFKTNHTVSKRFLQLKNHCPCISKSSRVPYLRLTVDLLLDLRLQKGLQNCSGFCCGDSRCESPIKSTTRNVQDTKFVSFFLSFCWISADFPHLKSRRCLASASSHEISRNARMQRVQMQNSGRKVQSSDISLYFFLLGTGCSKKTPLPCFMPRWFNNTSHPYNQRSPESPAPAPARKYHPPPGHEKLWSWL